MNSNSFLSSKIPSLDLHGYNRYEATVLIEEFINNSLKLNYHLIAIIHGKGEGILKEVVIKIARENRKVKNYHIDMFNDGCTIFEI